MWVQDGKDWWILSVDGNPQHYIRKVWVSKSLDVPNYSDVWAYVAWRVFEKPEYYRTLDEAKASYIKRIQGILGIQEFKKGII